MTDFETALQSVKPISAEPFPFTALQREWIEDLKGCPPDLQGTGWLLRIGGNTNDGMKPGFCCLGRALIVAGAETSISQNSVAIRFSYKEESVVQALPGNLALEMQMTDIGSFRGHSMDQYDFPTREIHIPDYGYYSSLTQMNDGRSEGKPLTFRQIAAFIEHDPWRVFALAPFPEFKPNDA